MSKRKSDAVVAIPDAWRQIVERKKTFIGWPPWSEVQALTTGPQVRTHRDNLSTVSSEITEASVSTR